MKKIISKPTQFSRTFLTTLLPTTATIIEAGAHDGTDTRKIATLFPESTVHAFEPVPHAYAQLKEAVADLKNVHVYHTALGTAQGTHEMFVTSGVFSATSSLFEPQEFSDIAYEKITVPITTLAQWASHNNVNHIDFMWLDAQGGELAILQGTGHLLTHTSALLVEINTTHRYKDIPLYHEIIQFLTQHHFALLLEHLHHGTWGNALFYNTQLIEIE